MHNQLIVVVEDERLVAEMIREILGLEGYVSVVVFSDPHSALERIQQDITPVLVISDFHLPGMSGVEFLDAVLVKFPRAQGIIVTADPECAREVSKKYAVLDKGAMNFHERFVEQIAAAFRHCTQG